MTDLLKGNFKVKRDVVVEETKDEKAELKSQYLKKALESIGGSMVFVERDKLEWDPLEIEADPPKVAPKAA
jgi:hypothetical protein